MKNATDKIHDNRLELRRIYKDMRAISPQTSLYKTLQARARAIVVQNEKLGQERIAQ